MNWDQVQGKWKQMKGSVKVRWGKLTDDDFDQIAGRRDKLAGKLQVRYGIAKEDAEEQLDEWIESLVAEDEKAVEEYETEHKKASGF